MSRENLRQLFLDFIDLGEDEEAWKINLGIYDDLLAEVKRLRSDLEINYQARRELEFETLEQQVLIYKLMKRNEWLEEVVALAQEHGAIDLSDYGWPQWGEEE